MVGAVFCDTESMLSLDLGGWGRRNRGVELYQEGEG